MDIKINKFHEMAFTRLLYEYALVILSSLFFFDYQVWILGAYYLKVFLTNLLGIKVIGLPILFRTRHYSSERAYNIYLLFKLAFHGLLYVTLLRHLSDATALESLFIYFTYAIYLMFIHSAYMQEFHNLSHRSSLMNKVTAVLSSFMFGSGVLWVIHMTMHHKFYATLRDPHTPRITDRNVYWETLVMIARNHTKHREVGLTVYLLSMLAVALYVTLHLVAFGLPGLFFGLFNAYIAALWIHGVVGTVWHYGLYRADRSNAAASHIHSVDLISKGNYENVPDLYHADHHVRNSSTFDDIFDNLKLSPFKVEKSVFFALLFKRQKFFTVYEENVIKPFLSSHANEKEKKIFFSELQIVKNRRLRHKYWTPEKISYLESLTK